jgi:hypothetical protein
VAAVELVTARNLGVRLARVASALKIVRVTTTQRQVDAPAYVTRGECFGPPLCADYYEKPSSATAP